MIEDIITALENKAVIGDLVTPSGNRAVFKRYPDRLSPHSAYGACPGHRIGHRFAVVPLVKWFEHPHVEIEGV